MTAMLNVQQGFSGAQDRQEHGDDRFTYENEDSGRLTSAPSPEPPYGMVVSDPTPTHVAHWGIQPAQPFTGYAQNYSIVPQYDPPPKKQRVERRRERLNYTRYQLEVLHYVYKFIRYPNNTQKQLIGKRVGISRHQAKIWFQNRRRKDVMKIPPAELPGDKPMVPDVIKKGVLSELLKHKDETPVKITFKSEKKKSVEQPLSVVMSPKNVDNVERSSPNGAQRAATPDVLLSSDSNASYSSQPCSAGQPPMSEDGYSDAHSNPGSPYSPQMTNGDASRHSSIDKGVYSDSPSNPGSPFSQFSESLSPISAFQPSQNVNQNRLNSPEKNGAHQHPTSSDAHREMFFHYNDGSYHHPGAKQAPLVPVFSYVNSSHQHTNEIPQYTPQQSSSPLDQEKAQSPKSHRMSNGASPQGFGHFPGYQEIMNYKRAHEMPNEHSPSLSETHSDDLVSRHSHSNSETGSDHGKHSDTSHLNIPLAHQAPAFNVNRVFPFPFYAEPPMTLSSMPNHHYQYHPAAWAYHPQAIQTAHNPFYGQFQNLTVEQPHPDQGHSSDGPDPGSSPPGALKDL